MVLVLVGLTVNEPSGKKGAPLASTCSGDPHSGAAGASADIELTWMRRGAAAAGRGGTRI